MKKNLNTLTLSGLMIGPILGSGIIFLPPLAFKALGSYAIWAWIIMMVLGILFAYVFAKMTVLTTSNEGMSVIIGEILGHPYRELASNYLTTAVCFGPVAVILTAASFLKSYFSPITSNELTIAFMLLLLCSAIVALGITAVGRLVLILSTITGILLVSGSTAALFASNQLTLPLGLPSISSFGHTLLLIFWSIIGWEILGNYIEEVKDPNKTIFQAMKISLIVIIAVYLITTFALQSYYKNNSQDIQIQGLLVPLFGKSSHIVFSVLAAGLCICTILMFVGAVSRQMTSRGKIGLLPKIFSKKYSSLIILTIIHSIVLGTVVMGWTNIEWMVAIANTFFIGNALLGLFAGFRYMKGVLIKTATAILIFMLAILLFFSSAIALIFLAIVTGLSLKKVHDTKHLSAS